MTTHRERQKIIHEKKSMILLFQHASEFPRTIKKYYQLRHFTYLFDPDFFCATVLNDNYFHIANSRFPDKQIFECRSNNLLFSIGIMSICNCTLSIEKKVQK